MARDFTVSAAMAKELEHLVPGGAHTYAKGADQYPEGMAPVIARGRGARVWDVDGNEYVEYGSGLRAVALGHAHPRVNAAVTQALEHGANFVRPAAIELEAARELLGLVPSADMVKFAKNGSDATTAAVRLARAVTGREMVAICADHPFFSVDDWFIGISPMPAGTASGSRRDTVTFAYDDLDAVRSVFERHPEQIAAVMLEPMTTTRPSPGYFAGLRRLCDEHGALLVLDEMITGFRFAHGGLATELGIDADLSTFGKAMGNGHSVSALAGRGRHMRRGGMDHADDRVFLLSTTHGAETHSLAAFLAVSQVHAADDTVRHLRATGERLAEQVRSALAAAGVADHVMLIGEPCNLVHATLDAEGQRSQAFRTLFLAGLLERGVIAPSFVVSSALTEEDVAATAAAVYETALTYRHALRDGIDRHLHGRPVRPALRARG